MKTLLLPSQFIFAALPALLRSGRPLQLNKLPFAIIIAVLLTEIVLAVLKLGHGDVVRPRRDGGHVNIPAGLLALGVDGGNGPTNGSATPYGTIIHKRPGYHATVVNSLQRNGREKVVE